MRRPFFIAFSAAALLLGCATQSAPPAPRGDLFKNLNISQEFMIPPGKYARKRMAPMNPTGITIHSTQSYGRGAGARTHARILHRGGLTASKNSLGYLSWHFSVDDKSIYQSLPTNERGEHADYEGPGNKTTIGIEMCENSDSNLTQTVDRTARLTAALMHQHGIPLSNVVPHQHWRQIRYADGRDLGHKNCPHFLMTNGKPGAKWANFKAKIDRYYRAM